MSEDLLYADAHDNYYYEEWERDDEVKKSLNNTSQHTSTQRGTAKVVDMANDIFQNLRDHSKPIIKSVWNNLNYPPLRWFGYGVAALNVVPLAILISFVIGTLALVLLVSGTG